MNANRAWAAFRMLRVLSLVIVASGLLAYSFAAGAQAPKVNPAGTWRHGPSGETWTFTATSGGRYRAEEKGFANARGEAYWTASGTFRVDYKYTYIYTGATVNGYYEMRFSPDGRTATGSWRELNGPKKSGTSNWTRVGAAPSSSTPAPSPSPPPSTRSLTGPWVHSADPRTQTPDSRVIVVQKGSNVTMTQSWKHNGRWMTIVCKGPLAGSQLKLQCPYAEGGNPFHFEDHGEMNLRLSSDGNHLDGSNRTPSGRGQEAHYSRVQ